MILVADSGSSKTDWILTIPKSAPVEFTTDGLNPYFKTEKEISKTLLASKDLQPYIDQITEVYFFGAGCSNPDKREIVSNGISLVLKNAFISVDSDIIGSAYATCGTYKGFTCVLGTGSNISFFNGKTVEQGLHGLGYILGDEGSGTYLGKILVTDYLQCRMPADLSKAFEKEYKVTKETAIHNVYQKPSANLYLASFAKFLTPNIDHPYIIKLLKKALTDFVESHILSYSSYKEFVCHFVGSIAFHFQDILREICRKKDIQVGKILQKPIHELNSYILKEIKFDVK
ncbi:N-acetylglucosamine kinase [Pedobacter sp. HMF7647]|uniref:N-acetylglucosamine kinase n=1 Tax=Hufsiella arboris TaxID=2695275 RepID=A0A7K1Y8Q6_9SPHI|nr:N-acetylglucosamine kinase [Hufsiella arboris]MXV50957.1 N-acetylglucosamine kinase [Hufsiella arboris]